ncbi:MAG: hypothetical protein V1929_08865 [bacterium]
MTFNEDQKALMQEMAEVVLTRACERGLFVKPRDCAETHDAVERGIGQAKGRGKYALWAVGGLGGALLFIAGLLWGHANDRQIHREVPQVVTKTP